MANAKQRIIGNLRPLTLINAAISTSPLNASNVIFEWNFQAETTDPITTLWFKQNGLTGTPGTVKYSLQGWSAASGGRDGTIKASSNAFGTKALGSGDNGTLVGVTLGTSYSPSYGELLTAVLEVSSGTFDASNLLTCGVTMLQDVLVGWPFMTIETAGSKSKQTAVPLFGYSTASAMYGFPMRNLSNSTFSSSTNPNEVAARFTVPSGQFSTYQIDWVRFPAALPSSANNLTISLYNGGATTDTTAAASDTFDLRNVNSTSGRADKILLPNIRQQTLNVGSVYRIGFANGSTSNMTIYWAQAQAQSDWSAWPDADDWGYSTRNGGNWTDDLTKRLQLELGLRDISYSSGGVIVPCFVGGAEGLFVGA